ncbi:unnamed protein product [Rotaria magnacalcarata]|uniref:Uncharacterized protein n=1 Tax=Rotaria magnacalcarata TaxID=392030 RepID=A0A815A3Q4_9BILA|nr:unnamed protein product [Rotaria magnacalcarata]CAF3818302.1 unnamed protein product [Rotaria magnacalcarata]
MWTLCKPKARVGGLLNPFYESEVLLDPRLLETNQMHRNYKSLKIEGPKKTFSKMSEEEKTRLQEVELRNMQTLVQNTKARKIAAKKGLGDITTPSPSPPKQLQKKKKQPLRQKKVVKPPPPPPVQINFAAAAANRQNSKFQQESKYGGHGAAALAETEDEEEDEEEEEEKKEEEEEEANTNTPWPFKDCLKPDIIYTWVGNTKEHTARRNAAKKTLYTGSEPGDNEENRHDASGWQIFMGWENYCFGRRRTVPNLFSHQMFLGKTHSCGDYASLCLFLPSGTFAHLPIPID